MGIARHGMVRRRSMKVHRRPWVSVTAPMGRTCCNKSPMPCKRGQPIATSRCRVLCGGPTSHRFPRLKCAQPPSSRPVVLVRSCCRRRCTCTRTRTPGEMTEGHAACHVMAHAHSRVCAGAICSPCWSCIQHAPRCAAARHAGTWPWCAPTSKRKPSTLHVLHTARCQLTLLDRCPATVVDAEFQWRGAHGHGLFRQRLCVRRVGVALLDSPF